LTQLRKQQRKHRECDRSDDDGPLPSPARKRVPDHATGATGPIRFKPLSWIVLRLAKARMSGDFPRRAIKLQKGG
jgi:hypothetical protein